MSKGITSLLLVVLIAVLFAFIYLALSGKLAAGADSLVQIIQRSLRIG